MRNLHKVMTFLIIAVLSITMVQVDASGGVSNETANEAVYLMLSESSSFYSEASTASRETTWWDACITRGVFGEAQEFFVTGAKLEHPTDYAGVILAMTAMEGAESAKDLSERLIGLQGSDGAFGEYLNQHIWAMIALDAAGASYPRAAALDYLLSMQNDDGGFGYSAEYRDTDLDLTAMALTVLGIDRPVAEKALASAVGYIKAVQIKDGEYRGGFDNYGINVNTIAIVISGLVAAGEDVTTDMWIVNGQSAIDVLAMLQLPNGAFGLTIGDTLTNSSATRQAIVALSDVLYETPLWSRLTEDDVIELKKVQFAAVEGDEEAVGDKSVYIEVRNGMDNSVVIPSMAVSGRSDTTAIQLLDQAVKSRGIAYEISSDGMYVKGIDGIYEFDNGSFSGWKFYCNGIAPNVSIGYYVPKDGDILVLKYLPDYTIDNDLLEDDISPTDRLDRLSGDIRRLLRLVIPF